MLLLNLSTLQRPVLHTQTCLHTVPELHLDVSTLQSTEYCAALGRVSLKGPDLHLDVSPLQSPVVHLDVSTLQGPELHLDVSKPQG